LENKNGLKKLAVLLPLIIQTVLLMIVLFGGYVKLEHRLTRIETMVEMHIGKP
jgi:hypothetical protein